jgi:hypothetical protein
MEKWDIHFSGMILSISWWLVTDVLVPFIGPTLKDQVVP